MSRRSLLFMPGNNPGMLTSGDVLGADTVILDLEDAVSLDEKDAARILVREALDFLRFTHSEVAVRVNPLDSPYWLQDLETVIPSLPDAIVIPKASVESVTTMSEVIERIKSENGLVKDISLLLIIETAMGLVDIRNIAESSPQIKALLLGAEDLSSDLGIKRTKGNKEIEYARFVVATTAKAFRMDAIDTPYTDIDDVEGLAADTAFAKSIGFTGRLAINPRQVETILEVFSPTEDEIEEAQAILSEAAEAKARGLGVFSYRGKMVDLPVIKRAENLMESARKWGLVK